MANDSEVWELDTITISVKAHVSLCRNTRELFEIHEFLTHREMLFEFKQWKESKKGIEKNES